MPGSVSRFVLPLVALATIGCLSVQTPGARSSSSMATRYEQVRDSLMSEGVIQRAGAPRIRLVIPTMGYATSAWVDASFRVSEDAYVLLVALDLDHRIRVIYPESPEQSGFVRAGGEPYRLARFHAGFGTGIQGYGSYQARYGSPEIISPFGGGGIMIAVASARPLQLERLLGAEGEFDDLALEQLLYDRSLPSAAHALAEALVLTGQEYDVDYTTFAGRRTLGSDASYASYASYAALGLSGCANGYDAGWVDAYWNGGYGARMPRFLGVYSRNGQVFARYANAGGCGAPVYYDVPVNTYPGRPRTPGDTVTTPPRGDSAGMKPPHFPGAPRFPSATPEHRIRLSASDAPPPDRDRPTIVSGLRIRPPDRIPPQAVRPARPLEAGETRMAAPSRNDPRIHVGLGGEPGIEPTRFEPRRDEPARVEPRMEPPRADAPRAEPARVPVSPAPAPVP